MLVVVIGVSGLGAAVFATLVRPGSSRLGRQFGPLVIERQERVDGNPDN